MVVVSQSQVNMCVCVRFVSQCLSGAACARPFCVCVVVGVVLCCMTECLPLDVHDSMCTSVSETASAALRTWDKL